MKRILSGVKPTGDQLHIGNYFGAVKRFVEMQKNNENFFFIANYHALTTVKNKEELEKQTIEIATEYLACGLDPNKSTLFFQSDVPEVTELTWYFNCLTPMGLLERAHAYKDIISKGKSTNVGLFDYPLLMASDILIYKSNIVPVGKDQKQHVEIARDVAETFNKTYGEVFPLPEPSIDNETQTIIGLDGQKMSKSYGNTINLFEDENVILKKIKRIVTDSKTVEESKNPDTCNVFNLIKLFVKDTELSEVKKLYKEGDCGYGKFKEILFEELMKELKPIREKYESLKKDEDYVLSVIKNGGKKAREVASETMSEVRKKMGIL